MERHEPSSRDPGEHKHALFGVCMERVDRALEASAEVDDVLGDVVAIVRDTFGADRAWLFHPCDPGAASFAVTVESWNPAYPGAKALGEPVPMTAGMAETCRRALARPGRAEVDPLPGAPMTNDIALQFNVRSMAFIAIIPRIGDAWMLGMHQCQRHRRWTDTELRLFEVIGRRLRGALSDKLHAERLRTSERTLRQFVDAGWEAIVVHQDGELLLANDQYHRMFGYEPEEIAGADALSLTTTPESLELIRGRIARGDLGPYEATGRRKGGQTFPMEIRVRNAEYQGRPVRVGAIRDLTDHRRAEAERDRALDQARTRARENEALLCAARQVLEETDFSVIARRIFDVCVGVTGARSGYVALASEDGAYNELLFLEPGGLPCAADPELLMPIRGLRAEAYRRGEPVVDNAFASGRHAALLPAGHVALDNVLFAPLNIDGETRGVIGLANKPGGFSERDLAVAGAFGDLAAIALRHARSRRELERSEARMRELFEGSRDGFVMVDAGGRITDANQAFCDMLGYTLDELRALPDFYAVTPEKWRAWEASEIWEGRLLGQGYSGVYEKEYERKDGTVFPVELQSYAVRGAGGELLYLWGVARDVTARRALQERLQQSHKMEAIGRLAGGVAHDFNNLLTVIGNCSDLLLEALSPADPLREDVQDIRHAARRAADLTRQLLAFGRKQVIRPRVIDVNRAVDASRAMLRRLMGEDIELCVRPAPDLWCTRFDPGQIDQILVNLAANARDAMPTGGTLTIATANVTVAPEGASAPAAGVPPGRYVLLAVSDTGVGMDELTRRSAFEPFFTTKDVGAGTGLGLATVYGIVRQHGGFVELWSEPGEGSTFRLLLPVAPEQRAPGEEAPAVRPAGGRETVLLVEDNEAVRRVTDRILRSAGYRTLLARGGAEALRMVDQGGPPVDLVLADVVMPGMSGKACVERLRARLPGLKALYMSGYPEDVIAARGGVLDAGTAFVCKPFTVDQLTRKVREVLDG